MNESYSLYYAVCNGNVSLIDPIKVFESEKKLEKELFSKIDALDLSPCDATMDKIFEFAKCN